MDEAVLHRPTGGPEVMAGQIDKVLKLAEEGRGNGADRPVRGRRDRHAGQ